MRTDRQASCDVIRLVVALVVGVACTLVWHVLPAVAQTAPSPGLRLEEVDGGVDYYGRFANGLPTDPSFFPIGVWLEAIPEGRSQIELDKDAGINVYVGIADPERANLQLLRSASMHAIIQEGERTRFTGIGSETAGWIVGDEVDMTLGPGKGYEYLIKTLATLPNDARLRYNNYGKGVLLWQSDQDAQRFVNEFQQVVSADFYWFTAPRGGCDQEARSFFKRPDSECRRAANYGATVERLRLLDGLDGQRMPIWNFVEVGWPFSETAAQGGRAIAPGEIRAAVWHSIIARARGIVYFNHSFGGPCVSHHALREPCYKDVRAAVKSVNAQIRDLAPVLNSPAVTSHFVAGSSVKAMMKWDGRNFYVFAGSAQNAASTASFSLPCIGAATAIVIGENRAIPVVDGKWADAFADGNAIHIYRIDGGSKCGLGE